MAAERRWLILFFVLFLFFFFGVITQTHLAGREIFPPLLLLPTPLKWGTGLWWRYCCCCFRLISNEAEEEEEEVFDGVDGRLGQQQQQHKRMEKSRGERWGEERRIIASFWMWQEQRAPAPQNRWPLASLLSPLRPSVRRPMISYKYWWPLQLDDFVSWWWWWPETPWMRRSPSSSSPFFLLNTHSICLRPLRSFSATQRWQDGWTDNATATLWSRYCLKFFFPTTILPRINMDCRALMMSRFIFPCENLCQWHAGPSSKEKKEIWAVLLLPTME